MFWKKKNLNYSILIPPLKKNFVDLTYQETKVFFDWFVNEIPNRIVYLKEICKEQLKIDPQKIDLSPESLIYVWEWFLKIAQIEKVSREEIVKDSFKEYSSFAEDVSNDDSEHFSLETEYILRDIGMYLGEVFVSKYPNIYWGFYTEPQSDFFVNMPLLLGFEDANFNPPFKMAFEPIHMAGVQASNLFDKTHNKKDLYMLYKLWEEQFIPKS